MTITATTYPTLPSFLSSMRGILYTVIQDLHLAGTSVTCSMEDCMQEGEIALMNLFRKLQRNGTLRSGDVYLHLKSHLWRYCKKTFFVKVPLDMKRDELQQFRAVGDGKHEEISEEILTEEDSFAEVELMQSILPHLNERERHVLDRRMNGYTAEEIALEMGMSRSNVCKIMKGIREIIEQVVSFDY